MYVNYSDFTEYAIGSVEYETFARVAPLADAVLDHWTLGRAGAAISAEEELPPVVVALWCAIAEALPSVMEEATGKGGRVSSFSNGVDSFTFAAVDDALAERVGWMLQMLPVEWLSGVVRFEGGNRYAR